ncbi:MAG: hypothetical protein F6K16_24565 [Symploca sp. SIO2B6]|nr:hypothetical protein [Symploca sp. SIO2B6]
MPSAVIINNYIRGSDSSFSYFQIQRGANTPSQRIEIIDTDDKARRIESQGGLSVPNDGQAQASFSFESEEEKYGGLLLQTRPMDISSDRTTNYRFPCEVDGQWIMAWRSSKNKHRNTNACGDTLEEGGIKMIRDPKKLFSSSTQPIELANILPDYRKKQNSSEQSPINQGSDDIMVIPGSGATVIRTTANPSIEDKYDLERCDDKFEGDHCQRKVTVQRDAISIEVLEGDILVESQRNPEGERVLEGQMYSYPREEQASFDVGEAANSCEMLRFLNAAYWSSPSTPQNIIDGIAEQLKQHREALGVSGRSPNTLSPLEQGVFDELNFARTNPKRYAVFLTDQKQYFYSNYLNLRGETVDLNRRVNAVNKAIISLEDQPTLPPLSISTGMSRANRDHVSNQGRSGKYVGHTDADSSGTGARLRRYGSVGCHPSYDEDEFENIVYFDQSMHRGVVPTSRAVVMEMLITYRPRQTGNPTNLFNKDFQVTGVACGSHSDFIPNMCVITYANGYLENN